MLSEFPMEYSAKKVVLIIERDGMEDASLREWALASSIIPVFVSNGVEALLWLGKGNIPDLILADAGMVPMPGPDFIRTIRSSGFFQEIPVIAFGLPEFHPSLAAMRQSGAVDHVFLPLEAQAMSQRLERFFAGRIRNSLPVIL